MDTLKSTTVFLRDEQEENELHENVFPNSYLSWIFCEYLFVPK